MRIILILAVVVLSINALSDEEQWQEFKLKYGKNYRGLREDMQRFAVFQQNLRIIEQHNEKYENGEISYKLGVNKFADLSQEEFKERLNVNTPVETVNDFVEFSLADTEIPDEVDWRTTGAVTPVKDQGECGACWAFGTTGSLESQYFIKHGELVSLSEQFLLDCATYNENGCRGGWPMNAFRTVADVGIVTEEEYPYEAEQKQCRHTGAMLKNIGVVAVKQNEDNLKIAVATVGPVAVTVDASYMYLYDGGVLNYPNCSSTMTNHVVLAVGYGTTDAGIDYWLVKNSWGADWGDHGYLKMSRNKNNQCAIASGTFYPLLI